MSDNNKLIILPSTEISETTEQAVQRMMERNLQITKQYESLPVVQEKEEVHRLEFVIWKAYTVCNVEINGVWRTCSFPATYTVGEFLLSGSISSAKNWPRGRRYDNGD